jgi:hypothetical protein
MKSSNLIKNLIIAGDNLHYPRYSYGYDMEFYPAFKYYYSKLRKENQVSLSMIFRPYGLNVKRLGNSNGQTRKEIEKLGNAGALLSLLEKNDYSLNKLNETFQDLDFYTTNDIIELLRNKQVIIYPKFYEEANIISTNFEEIFSAIVNVLDGETVYFNVETLKIVDDDIFYEKDLFNIIEIDLNNFILTANEVSSLACLIDENAINPKSFSINEYLTFDLLAEIDQSISYDYRWYFQNTIGLCYVMDCLNHYSKF